MTVTSTVVYDGPDRTDYEDWDDVALTKTFRTVWKPGTTEYNRQQTASELGTALASLENSDNNWATLNAGQRDAAVRLAVRTAARVARLQLGRHESP